MRTEIKRTKDGRAVTAEDGWLFIDDKKHATNVEELNQIEINSVKHLINAKYKCGQVVLTEDEGKIVEKGLQLSLHSAAHLSQVKSSPTK